MTKKKFFSIVIITKNEQKYLPILLESIHKQDFHDYEIIVSDADSTDKTRKIAKAEGCKIVLGGPIDVGRNNGAFVAKGEYIVFLDADMQLPPNFLSLVKEKIDQKNAQIGSVFLQFDTNKISLRLLYFFSDWTFYVTQRIRPHGFGGCIFVNKSLHKTIGGFRDILPFEDQDYIHRATKIANRFYLLRKPVVLTTSRRIEKDGYLYVIFRCLRMITTQLLGGARKGSIEYDYDYDE